MPSGPSTHYPLSENAVADLVDTIKSRPDRRDELVALLPENAAIYAGRGTNATIRLKGYILAAFEQVGAPPAAMPYILDELQNGRDAYTTAAAAKALRGLDAPSAKVLSSLLKAVDNIRYVDDAISFARYKPQWPVQERTTALEEIFSSFAWLGSMARPALPDLELLQTDPTLSDRARGCIARAIDTIRAAPQHVEAEDCCGAPLSIDSPMQADRCSMPPTHVVLEDQDGRIF